MYVFKVGDKVKIVNRKQSAASARFLGKIGIVEMVDYYDQKGFVTLEINGKSADGGIWFDEIELVNGDWDD